MAGQGRLDRDHGGLPVADLTDEDDVRVGAQDGSKRGGEREPRPRVHLDLVDAGKPVLDGVLDRDDVSVRLVHDVERRVERRGLARACRAGHEDGAVRLRVGLLIRMEGRLAEPQVLQAQQDRALVEDPDDHLLAVHGGKGREAKVDRLAGDGQADAPVLGDPALGDVDVRHDLQAADEAGLDVLRRAHDLRQHAVDPVTDANVALHRLDVDVRGPVGDRLADEEVHHLDDRALLDRRRRPLHLGQVVLDRDRGLRRHRLHGLVEAAVLADGGVDVARRRDDRLHLAAGQPEPAVAAELRVLVREVFQILADQEKVKQLLVYDFEMRHRLAALWVEHTEHQGDIAPRWDLRRQRAEVHPILDGHWQPGHQFHAASRAEPGFR